MFGRVIKKIFNRDTPVPKAPAPAPKAMPKPSELADSPFGRKAIPSNIKQPEAPTPPEPPPAKPETKPPPGPPAAERAKREWQAKAGRKLDEKESPEVLCGIDKNMPITEIESKLSALYRRHNRAASSLDPKLREESELMLEAIATLKERYLGKR